MALVSLEYLNMLRAIDSPTIANAIETFNVRPRVAGFVGYDIRCLFPELPSAVGYAVTCTVDSTTEERKGVSFKQLYQQIADLHGPTIVVMQDVGVDKLHSCHAGEIMVTKMKRLGAVGLLTDGGVRDFQAVKALGDFHYFCAGLVVSHGNPICVSVGEAITISGMRIQTGDLLHGDANGIVHIPDECIPDVVATARKLQAEEEELLRHIHSSAYLDSFASHQ